MSDPTIRESSAHESEASVIVETAIAAAEVKYLGDSVDQIAAVVVPRGGEVRTFDLTSLLAKHQLTPARATGTHVASTVKSFIDLVARHQSSGLTVWIHPTEGKIAAILNDHEPNQDPAWGDHRVELNLLWTEEWQRWGSRDGRFLGQQEFAEHIQDGMTEIYSPPAADLLEIVQTMQGSTTAAWKSSFKLSDGSVKLEYSEEVDATAGRNQHLTIPTEFVLVLSPFVGEPQEQLEAHMRWRVSKGNQLTLGYKLDHPERAVEKALERIAARIEESFPGDVYFGTARS